MRSGIRSDVLSHALGLISYVKDAQISVLGIVDLLCPGNETGILYCVKGSTMVQVIDEPV